MLRKIAGILLMTGFALYLVSFTPGLFTQQDPAQLVSVGASLAARTPAQSGSANAVTAVVVQFRGLDTLGEVTVLFVSAVGVSLLAGAIRGNALAQLFPDDGGFVLQTGARLLLPFIILIGIYITFHGHLSPGGGFPGGVLIATAVLVLILTSVKPAIPSTLTTVLEGLAGLSFIGIGIAGLFSSADSFLANMLPKGEMGQLLSAGTIPIIYTIVAIKVASELTNVVAHLTGTGKEEAQS